MDIFMRRGASDKHPPHFYSVAMQYVLELAPPNTRGDSPGVPTVHLKSEWGSVGDPGRVRYIPYPSVEAAEAAAAKLVARKREQGFA